MKRAPLPLELPPSFSVSAARRAGVPKGRLRAADLVAPHHGVRTQGFSDDPRVALRGLFDALPAHAFACDETAAAIWGLPLPRSQEDSAWLHPVIGVPADATRIRRKTTRGRRLQISPSDVVLIGGIPVTSVERSWLDLSGRFSHEDFLALTDHMLARRRPLATRESLTSYHLRHPRYPGAAQRAFACAHATERSESPAESRLRGHLIMDGLPAPECNVEIHHQGRFVARVDQLYRSARLVIEYDGDYHRDHRQWSRDQSRRAELESLGLRVTVVTSEDLRQLPRLLARIRRLLAQGSEKVDERGPR